jgi:hypothetical protein
MPPALIVGLVTAGLTYGPQFVSDIVAILNNPAASVADVEAAFANLKPYAAYGIPDIAPTKPTVVVPTQIPVTPSTPFVPVVGMTS